MKRTIRAKWLSFAGVSAFFLSACGGELGSANQQEEEVRAWDETTTQRQAITNPHLYDFITGISRFVLPEPGSSTQQSSSQEEVRDETVNVCSYTQISETSHFDKLASFDPNADALWPGALVQGQTLNGGLLTPIGTQRAAGTITLTNARIDGSSGNEFIYSRTLPQPSLASTQEAIHQILSAESINFAAKVAYTMHQAHSLNEGAVKAGIAAQFLGNSLSSTFGQQWTQSKTTFLADFTQGYYTVSFGTPADPTAFFAPTVQTQDLQPFMSPGNPSGYVSSVTYGRRLLAKFESNESSAQVSAALNAAFAAGKFGGSISLDASQRQTLTNTKMTLLALGGPSGSAVEVLGTGTDKVFALQNYFQQGANFSSQSPGVPLSYTVRYLRDFLPFTVASTTNYTVPNCLEKRNSVIITLKELAVYKNGESFGKGEINYDIFVGEGTNQTRVASGHKVKRRDNTTIALNIPHVLQPVQRSGNTLVVRAEVSEHNKNAPSQAVHTFSIPTKDWMPKGDREIVGEHKNLKVGLRYNVSVQ